MSVGTRVAAGLMHWLLRRNVVTDIRSAHPEDYIFRNIGGVIGDALQITSHEQCIERLPGYFGTIVHGLDQRNEGLVFHAIDDIIHFKNSLRKLGFAFNE